MSLVKATDLLRIAMKATGSVGVTLQDLRDELGCSHRTAQRWTNALEQAFPQTEVEDGEDRQRRWRIPARHLAPLLTPTGDELAAIGIAIRELEDRGLSEQARQLRELRAKVRTLSPPVGRARREVDEEILLEAMGHAARPGPRPRSDATLDASLVEAFKGPFVMQATYEKPNGDIKRRRLAPHGILLGTRRYLVARDLGKPASAPLQHFRLDGLSQVEVTGETFEMDAGFDLAAHAETGFGSYVEVSELVDVVWRFSPEAAGRAAEFQFHPTQQLEWEKDGSLLVRFQACGEIEMCWFLYQWGETVEVLQPATLRTAVHPKRRPFSALP